MASKEYLADGFRSLDSAQNIEAYFDCLNLLDTLPYYQDIKKKSYDLPDLHEGLAVFEAGCGLGHDVFRMAGLVLPGGRIIGLNSSKAMIATEKSNPLAAELPVEFVQGDIKALPFPDQSFQRCRTDRTLQYIGHPQMPVSELDRLLKLDALLLAYDNT